MKSKKISPRLLIGIISTIVGLCILLPTISMMLSFSLLEARILNVAKEPVPSKEGLVRLEILYEYEKFEEDTIVVYLGSQLCDEDGIFISDPIITEKEADEFINSIDYDSPCPLAVNSDGEVAMFLEGVSKEWVKSLGIMLLLLPYLLALSSILSKTLFGNEPRRKKCVNNRRDVST